MASIRKQESTARSMTSGPIALQILLFSLPLMLGNAFQMLYNTVDVYVVGNYVSTQALAAVGSTTVIINMLVFFFNGFSAGASVVIGQRFGARDMDRLHTAIETTMMSTFCISAVFTLFGVLAVRPMLHLMSTPEDVIADATIYLRIYFAGISGLLIYNMGSGILRAVGDSVRPLIFLAITSVLNIALDLLFVLVFGMGIAGVAYATIISQFISATLILILLSRSKDIYRMTWKDLSIDRGVLGKIVQVGLPAAIQSTITAFSNTFVQGYVNSFGSNCMAGWSCYNKLDQFLMLPLQSMAMASTTFVSQNIGAGQYKRADRGTVITVLMAVSITGLIATGLFILAVPAVTLFTDEAAVIELGSRFLRVNVYFILFNCVNHVLAGALRGRGRSRAPMIIMISCFVGIRQLYLFIATHFFANTPVIVGFGYPVGWMSCCLVEVTYYFLKVRGRDEKKISVEA